MGKWSINPITIRELRVARSDNLYAGLVLVEHEKPKSRLGLVGKKFGRLTVIDDSGTNKHRQTLAYCLCECGRFTTVVASKIKRGETVSCGCYRLRLMQSWAARWRVSRRRHPERCHGFKDLAGKRFGRWTVLELTTSRHRGSAWLCSCDCGGRKKVDSRSLIHGKSTSCGCYSRERAAETCRQRKVWELSPDWAKRQPK